MTHQEQPPSYDAVVTSEVHSSGPYVPAGTHPADVKDVKSSLPPMGGTSAGPPPPSWPSMPATVVYNYVNPTNGDVVSSLLPPDHPEMVCLQQGHLPHTRYGILGVLAAVFWFPLGIGLCLLDRRVKCGRCGRIIDDGLCSM
ncbi:hypothetical protein PHLGIDRAFT_18938 [Phlebiopsis gigantea 11061_1 CR5-6]|uniref:Uncharacterized protein n=1 Tax=Phlebiopsis gigantea (strain 11061_1 CR5-6) TaxID=745531 RepID=A0A0C3S0I9_PHLG1|nr:hypothetical protein PHLGIDRAFT_18938 [Phlebiopsis gigantea 11061_1 CR5-6]